MAKAISQRKLDAWKREWQKKLRLQDWRIKVRFSPKAILQERTGVEGAVGCCSHHEEAKAAEIDILRPEDWDAEFNKRQQDVEDTIVHELLHCHFAAFRGGERATQLAIEQIIETVTEAILNEKRRK